MSTNQELSIKGKLTLEDFKMYNTHHLKKTVRMYFIICFVAMFAIIHIPMSGDLFLIFIFAGIPSLIISSLLALFAKTVNKRRAIKEYKSDQLIKHEINYIFSHDGIHQKIRRSNNYYEWNDIQVAIEQKDMFLLYVSKNKAIVLPKSFFESSEKIDLFKKIISEYIETAKIKFY
ncbi:YcxB-like protein [Pelagirhabdus alkalitolerans]|uniref:YcxB-like protein n=1 Tax=Pelagirhabdus alkalitolerans TaxID=1612202 RepID=A0A1G6H691_9BACI|nr:YcxB family protein [Pelagirhabdus alkalitolerans]SDB89752.1 YcxB-like protein [Pelagirhabdus alkalitolerans]